MTFGLQAPSMAKDHHSAAKSCIYRGRILLGIAWNQLRSDLCIMMIQLSQHAAKGGMQNCWLAHRESRQGP